jgi:hypothetical protein
MSQNDLVPCGLGQACVKETTNYEGYTVVAICNTLDRPIVWSDIRKGYSNNYYFFDRPTDRDYQYVIVDNETYNNYWNFYKNNISYNPFGNGHLSKMNWQDDFKYVAREQRRKLYVDYWIYDQVKVEKPKESLKAKVEKPKKSPRAKKEVIKNDSK